MAIVDIPEILEPFEDIIAETLIQVHRNVRSVLAKASERHGQYRVRDLRLLKGDEDTEVLHKEAGYWLRLDPRRVYFSPRESTERARIASMVSVGEQVLVMFGGICPFSLAIAKAQRSAHVTSVELSPEAHSYCIQNVMMNKVADRITPIPGDVRKICPEIGPFDRTLMPMPKGASEFLDVAIPTVKAHGVLHLYHWSTQGNLFSEAEAMIETAAEELNRKALVKGKAKVLPYGPRTWKIRVDAEIV